MLGIYKSKYSIEKKVGFFFLATIDVFFNSCDFASEKLLFVNKTNNETYIKLTTSPEIYEGNVMNTVAPQDSIWPHFSLNLKKEEWIEYIYKNSPDSTAHLFICKERLVTKEMLNRREYKQINYKVSQLELLDWRIEYNDSIWKDTTTIVRQK